MTEQINGWVKTDQHTIGTSLSIMVSQTSSKTLESWRGVGKGLSVSLSNTVKGRQLSVGSRVNLPM